MKAKTREPRWGRKSGLDRDNRAEQEGEGATNEGSAAGAKENACHGLEHPGWIGKQPGLDHLAEWFRCHGLNHPGRAGKNQQGFLAWNI